MAKTDRTVVRNQPYQRKGIGIRERHNERKNESYSNPDIQLERSQFNIHFKKCESTYEQTLSQMLEQGVVSTKGLQADADIFEEMVFDVNSNYFENHGGYEYAKQFFKVAFHFAEKEVSSQYILSAVMHADERNKYLSEQLGRDVYHYHMHVIYLPVVDTVKCWSKRCKDKSLVGKPKEVFHQISHSKKWKSPPALDENGNPKVSAKGKAILIPSYSLLQDRFFEHMKSAGFKDFERGVKGSTTEHLDDMDFKIQQDGIRIEMLKEQIDEQENNLGLINLELDEVKPVKAAFDEISIIGKKKLLGNKIEMTSEEYQKLQNLAKEGFTSRKTIENLNHEVYSLKQTIWKLKDELDTLYDKTKDFFRAIKLAPEKVKAFFIDLFTKEKEEAERKKQERLLQRKQRSNKPSERDVR